jgi:translation initiation factor IF-2
MAKKSRPPVVTIMGHVDHGKTTLLDYIRNTKVVAKEAGGITQHIGAYSINHQGKDITFIDTPGHAAFNKMRERGAKITDIVILVVAANDGVKPQTIESIRHITNAKVPVVVAINKIDLADVNPDLAKSGLAEHGLVVTDYGGDIESVEISALKGNGVDKLLETVNLIAELHDFQADSDAPLEAVVIESGKDSKKGVYTTILVQNGTLKVKQDVVATDITGETIEAVGRVKRISDALGQTINEVKPGFAAEVSGFKEAPVVGATIRDDNADYTQIDAENELAGESDEVDASQDLSDQWGDIDFSQLVEEQDKEKINLIIKADTKGSLEVILQNIDEDSTNLIISGIGEVTEQDVEMAETSGALILAFHTKVPKNVKIMAKTNQVKIKSYDVIYKLIEDLQKQMLKLLEPTIDEVVTGEAEILEIFEMKGERIAGCKVKKGEIKKTDKLHLKRDDKIIADPAVKNMMHGKDDITQAKVKGEFGMTFKNKKLDFAVGDILVAYTVEDEE